MEAILQGHNNTMPAREVLVALAEKFRWALSSSQLWLYSFFYKRQD